MILTVLRSAGECGLVIRTPVIFLWRHIMLSNVHSPSDIRTDLMPTTPIQVESLIILFFTAEETEAYRV